MADDVDPLFVGDERSSSENRGTNRDASRNEPAKMGIASSLLVSRRQIAVAIAGLLPSLLLPLTIEFSLLVTPLVVVTGSMLAVVLWDDQRWKFKLRVRHRNTLLSAIAVGTILGLAIATLVRWVVRL
jgi:hypothetical protein